MKTAHPVDTPRAPSLWPRQTCFEALIDGAGWSFERGTGRKGSWFVRKDTGPTPEEAVSPTVPTASKATTELEW
jgi:hypothetical protein